MFDYRQRGCYTLDAGLSVSCVCLSGCEWWGELCQGHKSEYSTDCHSVLLQNKSTAGHEHYNSKWMELSLCFKNLINKVRTVINFEMNIVIKDYKYSQGAKKHKLV